MGVGKTTLGRYFARTLSVDFKDSDEEIEKRSGISIPDIFELSGEEKFRDIEHRVISDILQSSPVILSTGGGAFISPNTREILRNKTVTIWLRAKPETLLSRMDNFHNRPLLAKGDPLSTLTNLSDERKRYYQQADVIIDTDIISATQAFGELVSALQKRDVLQLDKSVKKE